MGLRIIIFVLISNLMSAQFFKVTHVQDGDTFYSYKKCFRIAEIDAPELKQPYGIQSKLFLKKLIFNKIVYVQNIGTDRYGRAIAKVYINRIYLPEILISNGQVFWYQKYSNNIKLKILQNKAKINNIGLWKYNLTTPSKFKYETKHR